MPTEIKKVKLIQCLALEGLQQGETVRLHSRNLGHYKCTKKQVKATNRGSICAEEI